MEEMTCEAVARLTRTNSKTLWELDQWRCEYLKKHLYICLFERVDQSITESLQS